MEWLATSARDVSWKWQYRKHTKWFLCIVERFVVNMRDCIAIFVQLIISFLLPIYQRSRHYMFNILLCSLLKIFAKEFWWTFKRLTWSVVTGCSLSKFTILYSCHTMMCSSEYMAGQIFIRVELLLLNWLVWGSKAMNTLWWFIS